MSNLVPLHLDKNTGRIIARGGIGSFAGGSSGYLYEQIVPSNAWFIPHNRSNDRVIVQIYDSLGLYVIPDEIIIANINNILVTFTEPMDGTAHIMFFKSN